MYTPEEFDESKTKVLKYILYKKRTEREVRDKFIHTMDEEMLSDIIEYLKEAGYINDKEYLSKIMHEYMNLKNMSIRELKNKVYQKGIYVDDIEEYINENSEELRTYEYNSAKKLAEKKKGTDPAKLKGYLLNKGFDTELVNKIMNED